MVLMKIIKWRPPNKSGIHSPGLCLHEPEKESDFKIRAHTNHGKEGILYALPFLVIELLLTNLKTTGVKKWADHPM